jgi:hypothetical protein
MSVRRLALSTALNAARVGIVERLPGVEDVMAVRTAMLRYWEGLDKFLDVPFGSSFEPPGDGEHDADAGFDRVALVMEDRPGS